MAKKYDIPTEDPMMASEPVGACRLDVKPSVQASHPMPCTYSDEEFKEELALSEASGFVSHEEFKRTCLEKWGVALSRICCRHANHRSL